MTLHVITASTSLREDLRGALSQFESLLGVYTVGAVGRSSGLAAVTAMAKSLENGSQQHEVNWNRAWYTFMVGSPSTSYRMFPQTHPPACTMV